MPLRHPPSSSPLRERVDPRLRHFEFENVAGVSGTAGTVSGWSGSSGVGLMRRIWFI
jgi:hypothetical protein